MSTTEFDNIPRARAVRDQAPPVGVRRAEATARPSNGAPDQDLWTHLKTPLEIGLVLLRLVEFAILIA